MTALMAASSLGLTPAVEALLQHGADLSLTCPAEGKFHSCTSLLIAAKCADVDTMAVLLSHLTAAPSSHTSRPATHVHSPSGGSLTGVYVRAALRKAEGARGRDPDWQRCFSRLSNVGMDLCAADRVSGMTALMHVCCAGNVACALGLLEALQATQVLTPQ